MKISMDDMHKYLTRAAQAHETEKQRPTPASRSFIDRSRSNRSWQLVPLFSCRLSRCSSPPRLRPRRWTRRRCRSTPGTRRSSGATTSCGRRTAGASRSSSTDTPVLGSCPRRRTAMVSSALPSSCPATTPPVSSSPSTYYCCGTTDLTCSCVGAAVELGRLPQEPRRAGLRAAGQPARPRLARTDQHVRQRQHRPRPRGALPPARRRYRHRLAPLRHRLDAQQRRLLPRWRPHPRGGPRPFHGRRLPLQAHVRLRHHLGRLQLGHRRRQVQGRLRLRALRRRVLRPRPHRLRRHRRRWSRGVPGRPADARCRRHGPGQARRHEGLPGGVPDLYGVPGQGALQDHRIPRVRRPCGRPLHVPRVGGVQEDAPPVLVAAALFFQDAVGHEF